MASAGYASASTLHFVVLCCAPLLRAHLVHIVTPQNTPADAAAATTTADTSAIPATVTPFRTPAATTPKPDSFLTAYHHAQKLRSAPADRNDFYDLPDNDPNRTYNTLIRSSHIPSDYPSITHDFLPVSPPPAPYAPPQPLPYPFPQHHSHHPHHSLPPLPAHSCHPTPYSSPSAPLFGLLPAKLSLKLLLKILLKLVLFKMVVKLIAVICLLLFIPALKSKETAAEGDAEDGRASQLASMVWDSLEEKNWMYGDDEMKDMREIAEEADDDEDEEENGLSGPLKAVRFLEFCVSAVDRVVGYILGILQRKRDEQEDLSSFVLEKLGDFVKQF